ncbi:nitrate transport permease nrtB [Paenibacillus sp. BIHB 4019]|uniref:Nitrate transport permease nrtB n=1 Tax=Paenibacillus sp. BIHB 4019 TaxID=1870819 RepID=A0A1B2DNJ3_9BACL|nr:ABC transporter permease [Paenibacillus sp. BIHB 4019]ANY69273.1 nitrate transport permease nrtB [Paenibacillus sp. BIHB 4019]
MDTLSNLFKIRGEMSRKAYMATVVGTFAAVFVAWSLLSYSQLVDPTFLPTPGTVGKTLWSSIQSADFWSYVGISSYRVLMGYLFTCLLAVPLGILAGTFKFAEAVLVPLTEFIRYMPATAFIPLIIVWIGLGEPAKIMVIFVGCFFQMLLMVADNARAVSNDLLQASYTLGANKLQVLRKVLLPALLPELMNTMRLIMGWAWSYLIASELFAASSGLGFMIIRAQRYLQTDMIFMGILVIGMLGLIIDRLFALLNKKLFPWAEGGR